MMNQKKNPLDNYRRFLLNRWSANPQFIEFIEHCIATEDEAANHCFHKVMVHGWTDSKEDLYDAFSDYFTTVFIPISGTTLGGITSFYTSSLSFINKIVRYDFMCPYQQSMFNIDVLFYDKSSTELFDQAMTIDDVVSRVVSRRFTEKQELDLSNFCNDQDLTDKKIEFYKISLLANFKILMLRMGRDTKALNLSNNDLNQPPIEILNFFIKGDLISIDLSNNNIQAIADLVRVSSKIEKLWVEGNPLCNELDPASYVKTIIMKFPRLSELDGIGINETGLHFPFVRNYMEPERLTKMLVEKFLSVYFSHYDAPQRHNVLGFYADDCTLSITTSFTTSEEIELSSYTACSRNLIKRSVVKSNRPYCGKQDVRLVLCDKLPATDHDPATFTVDVVHSDRLMLVVIVTGIFREKQAVNYKNHVIHFRRTFVFKNHKNGLLWKYAIANEMMHLTVATREQIDTAFKHPTRNHTTLSLMSPERDEIDAVVKIFTHIAQLKKEEAEFRLRLHKWDIREAMSELVNDIATNKLENRSFADDDDLSDMSSLIDEDMVD